MRAALLAALAASAISTGARADGPPDPPIIVNGTCGGESAIGSGPSSVDLSESAMAFHCDTAIITRVAQNRLMIQFASRAARTKEMIGFAGDMNDVGVVVDHVYLARDKATDADEGLCVIEFGPPLHIKAVICGARTVRGDLAMATKIFFVASSPHRHRGH